MSTYPFVVTLRLGTLAGLPNLVTSANYVQEHIQRELLLSSLKTCTSIIMPAISLVFVEAVNFIFSIFFMSVMVSKPMILLLVSSTVPFF